MGHPAAAIRELAGHGIGRTIHEPPHVPNYPDPKASPSFMIWLAITVEPIISSGSGQIVASQDGWTVRTADQKLSAHFEHALVITAGMPMLLTAV